MIEDKLKRDLIKYIKVLDSNLDVSNYSFEELRSTYFDLLEVDKDAYNQLVNQSILDYRSQYDDSTEDLQIIDDLGLLEPIVVLQYSKLEENIAKLEEKKSQYQHDLDFYGSELESDKLKIFDTSLKSSERSELENSDIPFETKVTETYPSKISELNLEILKRKVILFNANGFFNKTNEEDDNLKR